MSVSSSSVEDSVRASLRSKSWIGFDLDDTLHEFRKASRAATTYCLNSIAEKHPEVSIEPLQRRYQDVLKQGTSGAFVDGKSSHEYRQERFIATLDHFGLSHDSIDRLLVSYEETLVQNLALKPGALSLLRAIKSSGRKIAVITEGPQDAQERALRDLGIAQYIDFLATTNQFRVSKVEGLFKAVLSYLGILPDQIAYVGDSVDRDVKPATAEGIYSVHFNEKEPPRLQAQPVSVQSLSFLESILPPLEQD